MKALVYHGPASGLGGRPDPELQRTRRDRPGQPSTICGTDLHILKGDVPAVTDGRILGHEAVGTVEAVGRLRRQERQAGRPRARLVHHRVRSVPLLPRRATANALGGGGWILGHLIDGTQAEYVRMPFADTSRVPAAGRASPTNSALMLADILPTAYEVGVLNGHVAPGDTVAIVGAGPIGLAAIMTAQL